MVAESGIIDRIAYPARATVDDELTGAAAPAGHDGQAAGERLEHCVGQRIVYRRKHERVRCAVERARIPLRPREYNAIAYAGAPSEPAIESRRLVAADDHETRLCRQSRERANGGRDTLARIARANEQEDDVLVGEAEARADRPRCRLRSASFRRR
jgi:hypothetical protein